MVDSVLDSPPAVRVLAASGVPGRLVAGAEVARRDLALRAPIHPGTVAADSLDTQTVGGRAAWQFTDWVTITLNTHLRTPVDLRAQEHADEDCKSHGYRYTDIALQAKGPPFEQRTPLQSAATAMTRNDP